MSLRRVAILGTGGMGTALAILWARQKVMVRLWGRDERVVEHIRSARHNTRHLPGVELPSTIDVTSDVAHATEGADLAVVAIPCAFLRATLGPLTAGFPKALSVASVVKGIEVGTFARPSTVIAECLGERPLAVLSGPSHAEEFARGLPASLVVASPSAPLANNIQQGLMSERFRVYVNQDLIGVELAGALKNVLGIAAGICEGLGFGDNAKAALLTRGLAEMTRFVVSHGGQASTLYGLAGVGDILTTCYSPHGRNRAVGLRLGRGETLDDIMATMRDVAEGVFTARALHGLASQKGLEMPICSEVYRILFENKPPASALTDLMLRPPKGEWC
jgi:glycerol-3-phosphate dehydrogenase (NAD(P)+)